VWDRPPGLSIFRRRAPRRGNTFLEVAFVLVPLLALLLGILDFGFAIFLRTTFQHAVREGVRYAVTYQTSTGLGHDASIKRVVQNQAMGFLSDSDLAQKVKIRYYQANTMSESNENSPGNLIEISVENYQYGWMAPLMRSAVPLNIVVRASDRMEGLAGGMSPPGR